MPASWSGNRPAHPRVRVTVGGKAPSTTYRITVTVDQPDGGTRLGSATKDVAIPLDGSQVQWQIDVSIVGDYAKATCGISVEVA